MDRIEIAVRIIERTVAMVISNGLKIDIDTLVNDAFDVADKVVERDKETAPAYPSWPQRFMELAALVASWSKDPSTQVGAVIVDSSNRIVSLGYNGPPRLTADSAVADREVKLLRTLHAEENAILFGGDVSGCALYVTHPPCAHCAAVMIQVGIAHVVWPDDVGGEFSARWQHSHGEAVRMLTEAGVGIGRG